MFPAVDLVAGQAVVVVGQVVAVGRAEEEAVEVVLAALAAVALAAAVLVVVGKKKLDKIQKAILLKGWLFILQDYSY